MQNCTFNKQIQKWIGDSKRQSEVAEDFNALFPSIEDVQGEAERDVDDDIEPVEPYHPGSMRTTMSLLWTSMSR